MNVLGFGAFAVANLFAWKATLPADLKRAADPVGALGSVPSRSPMPGDCPWE